MITHVRHALVAAAVATLSAIPIAAAGDLSKEECVDAHSRGQDAKEQNKISLARKLFLTCAQPSCPSLVQGDCARYADDLGRQQPSLSFAARDGAGADLPDTTVYVDDVLIVTRLDDGRPHDVDPGKHSVRFQNGGKEQVVTVVVGTGEKGRTVVGSFGSPAAAAAGPATVTGTTEPVRARKLEPTTKHPGGAKAVMGLGAVMVVAGTGLAVWGTTKLPSACSTSTHQCAAPPGDAVFTDAASAVKLTNIGIAIGAVGLAALAGGTVWYFKGAHTERPDEGVAIIPWIDPSGGGLTVSGHL
ncbi:MAG: hypothetical protein JWO36_579 [Myxococcales bacterium]|nr:hypothetical protein [Myxococcales bacterium]